MSDDDWGVQSPPKRKVFRFHETILRFGEPGSLGYDGNKTPVFDWDNGFSVFGYRIVKPLETGRLGAMLHPAMNGHPSETKPGVCVVKISHHPREPVRFVF